MELDVVGGCNKGNSLNHNINRMGNALKCDVIIKHAVFLKPESDLHRTGEYSNLPAIKYSYSPDLG